MSAQILRIHPVTWMETVQTQSGLSLVSVNRDISVQDSTVLILMSALSFQEKFKNQKPEIRVFHENGKKLYSSIELDELNNISKI